MDWFGIGPLRSTAEELKNRYEGVGRVNWLFALGVFGTYPCHCGEVELLGQKGMKGLVKDEFLQERICDVAKRQRCPTESQSNYLQQRRCPTSCQDLGGWDKWRGRRRPCSALSWQWRR